MPKTTVKSIDFMGEEPKFTYNGRPRYQTFFGAFVSVIVVLTIAISIWKSFNDFNDPNSVEVSTSTVFEKIYPKINMIENDFYPILAVRKIGSTVTGPLLATEAVKHITIFGIWE
jgi:hypothetical protein